MSANAVVISKAMGQKIKFRRQDLGMSQERLAELLGVSYQQVQRYESGRNRLNVENIQVIAQALAVPVTYFFDASDAPAAQADSPDEKTLLKYFRRIDSSADRQAVLAVAKRLAAK